MRMLQASAALLEYRTWLWTVVHVRATQYQTANTTGAIKWLIRWRDALVQLRRPSAFAPSTFGSGTLQTTFAIFMLGASLLTLRATQFDAGSLEDVV